MSYRREFTRAQKAEMLKRAMDCEEAEKAAIGAKRADLGFLIRD